MSRRRIRAASHRTRERPPPPPRTHRTHVPRACALHSEARRSDREHPVCFQGSWHHRLGALGPRAAGCDSSGGQRIAAPEGASGLPVRLSACGVSPSSSPEDGDCGVRAALGSI